MIAYLEQLFKVIVAGSRGFNDFIFLTEKLDRLLSKRKLIEIVSGTANGADKLGERYATLRNIPVKQFPANWNKYGQSAGYIRNTEMAEYSDALVAFWDGESKGTKHMIDIAREKELEIRIIKYTERP